MLRPPRLDARHAPAAAEGEAACRREADGAVQGTVIAAAAGKPASAALPFTARTFTGRKFIFGEPMKPATNMLRGR